MPKPPIKQLSDLILLLFPRYEELRSFLLGLPEGEVILTEISGKDAPGAAHAHEVASGLRARGLIDPELFRSMIEARQARADEIVRVAEAHLLDVAGDAKASTWVVHALRREAALVGRIAKMEGELSGLKERVRRLETQKLAAPQSKEEEWNQLYMEMCKTTFDFSRLFPSEGGEKKAAIRQAPAPEVLFAFKDLLANGVTDLSSNEQSRFLFHELVPCLRLYDLVEDVKLPARMLHKEVRLSKKGRDFVAWMVKATNSKAG